MIRETSPFRFDFNSIGIDSGFFFGCATVTAIAANMSAVVVVVVFLKANRNKCDYVYVMVLLLSPAKAP